MWPQKNPTQNKTKNPENKEVAFWWCVTHSLLISLLLQFVFKATMQNTSIYSKYCTTIKLQHKRSVWSTHTALPSPRHQEKNKFVGILWDKIMWFQTPKVRSDSQSSGTCQLSNSQFFRVLKLHNMEGQEMREDFINLLWLFLNFYKEFLQGAGELSCKICLVR